MALAAGAAPAPALTRADPAPQLREQIVARISQPRYQHAAWGIKIVSLDTGVVLFGHQSHKLLKPASNAKLFTGALVLDRLAPDYRIRTSVLAAHKPKGQGVIEGDLVVYGRGDPTLAARFEKGQYDVGLRRLADVVVAAGVKEISGDLVGDETYFRGGPAGASWAWDDLPYYYGAEVSALTLEDNVIDLVFRPGTRVGEPCLIEGLPKTEYLTFINRSTTRPNDVRRTLSIDRPLGENKVYLRGSLPVNGAPHTNAVTVHQPARYFVTQLRNELVRRGVRVGGVLRMRDGLAPGGTNGLVEVAFILSRPLREILPKMLKPSQNLYAQLLLLQAGATAGSPEGDPPVSTEELGIAELTRFLTEAGIPHDEVLLDEGSGLSRSALVTPDAIVRLLQYLDRHRWREVWLDSLPVAGIDGTLGNRMRRSAAAGNARAKTGSLRFVNALSGYVTSAAGERLAYCLMVNNCKGNANEVRNDLDSIVVLLAELNARTRKEK